MQFVGGSSPDEIPIPGQISMDIDSILTEDMPNELKEIRAISIRCTMFEWSGIMVKIAFRDPKVAIFK